MPSTWWRHASRAETHEVPSTRENFVHFLQCTRGPAGWPWLGTGGEQTNARRPSTMRPGNRM